MHPPRAMLENGHWMEEVSPVTVGRKNQNAEMYGRLLSGINYLLLLVLHCFSYSTKLKLLYLMTFPCCFCMGPSYPLQQLSFHEKMSWWVPHSVWLYRQKAASKMLGSFFILYNQILIFAVWSRIKISCCVVTVHVGSFQCRQVAGT